MCSTIGSGHRMPRAIDTHRDGGARCGGVIPVSSGRYRRLIAQWARQWGVPELARRVSICISPRLRRSLGRCRPSTDQIVISSLLFTGRYRRLIKEVLCHELAHIATRELYAVHVRPHGPEWVALVLAAGLPARVRLLLKSPPSMPRRKRAAHLYEHRCPVCHMVRISRRRMRGWRCAACVAAGLSGKLAIRRVASEREGCR